MKFSKVALSLAAILVSNKAFSMPKAGISLANDVYQDIEKIVITGQKIDRSLKETPNSVSVLTSKALENKQIKNVADLYASIPNVSGDFSQGFSIRGINAFSVSGGGNSYLTSMYLDGAPLPYRVIRSGATSVWDLSQIEVFRGPQSTLQGRNALAGAIMLRSTDPSYEWAGKAKATLGQNGQQELAFAGGGELIDNMLAFRISAETKDQEGDIYNITRQEKANFEESEMLRVKALFQPTNEISALFTAIKTKNKMGPQWSTFAYGSSPYDREVNFNSEIWESTDTTIYNLEMAWAVSDQFSIHAVSTVSDSDYGYNWDGDMQPTQQTLDNTYTRNDKTVSQEVRFVYESENLAAVFGGYYSKLNVDDAATGERLITFDQVGLPPLSTLLVSPTEFGGFGLPAEVAAMVTPLYPNVDPIKLGLGSSIDQKVTTAALYADITWSLNERFDIISGLRYDQEKQTNSANNAYTINNILPSPSELPSPISQIVTGINGALLDLAANASGIEPASSARFSDLLPKLGMSYHINEDATVSLMYQKGYRSGGVGTNIARSSIYTYEPEYTNNYELSLRSVWLNGNLMFNSNLFLTQWQDQQIAVQLSNATFDTETINAGKSNIKGFEAELFYYPSNNLSVTAGVGLAKSEFTTFNYIVPSTNKTKDLSGRSFADAPKWTANIAVNYEFDSGIFTNLSADYASSSQAYIDPDTTLSPDKKALNPDPKNDARLLINAQVGYEWEHYTLRLNIKNVLNENYINQYFFRADNLNNEDSYGQMSLGRSRQINLSLEASF